MKPSEAVSCASEPVVSQEKGDFQKIRFQTETESGTDAYYGLTFQAAYELNRVACVHHHLCQFVLGDSWSDGRQNARVL